MIMATENTNHPIYDELKQLAEQSEFIMHCVTLHYSPDSFTAMADTLKQIHFAVLDKTTDMDGQERSDMKESINQFMEDAVQMRKFIEIMRLHELKKKGREVKGED